jgi:hypothetical protein
MRSRRSIIIAAILLIAGLSVATWAIRHQLAARQRLIAWQTQRAQESALDREVEIRCDGPVLLLDWLHEWSRQSGIHHRIYLDSDDPFRTERFELELPNMTAREALQALATVREIGWEFSDGNVTVFPNSIGCPYHTRVYTLPEEFSERASEEFLFAVTIASATGFPNNPIHQPLNGSFQLPAPGSVSVVHRYDQQLCFAMAYEQLRVAIAAAQSNADPRWQEDDIAWQARPICEQPEKMHRLLQALEQPVSLRVINMPVREFAAKISDIVGVPVFFDLSGVAEAELLVDCRVEQLPLRFALRHALEHLSLTYVPIASGQALQIIRSERDLALSTLVTLAYPIRDFNLPFEKDEPFASLEELVEDFLIANSQGDTYTEVQVVSPAGLLAVTATLPEQLEVQTLLNSLRRARHDHGPLVSPIHLHANEVTEQLQTLLQQSVPLQYDRLTPQQFVDDLRNLWNLPIDLHASAANLVEGRAQGAILCRLPARPLEENLRTIVQAMGLELLPLGGRIAIVDPEFHRQMQTNAWDIYDLRGWQAQHQHAPGQITNFVAKFEPDSWLTIGGPGSATWLDGLLVVGNRPDIVRRVREAVRAATTEPHTDLAQLSSPQFHRGEETLHQETARQETHRKLQQSVSASFQKVKRADAILTMASRYDLPLLMDNWGFGAFDFDGQVSLKFEDQPLGDVLQQLTGDPYFVEYVVRPGGTVSFIPSPGYEPPPDEWNFFEVGDLVHPRGNRSALELFDAIRANWPTDFDDTDPYVHLDRFLAVVISAEEAKTMGKILTDLRTASPSTGSPSADSNGPAAQE